jgi:hypothetical protein
MAGIARTVSMALLGVTLCTGSASAECAWVLWSRVEARATPAHDPWGIVQAFPTRVDCVVGMRILSQKFTASGSTVNEDAGGGSFSAVTKDGGTFSFGRCLPDTVDPRWPTPKKKGR